MNAIETAQKIIDYLRIEVEVKPGGSASDVSEIAEFVQQAINAAQPLRAVDVAMPCPNCKSQHEFIACSVCGTIKPPRN